MKREFLEFDINYAHYLPKEKDAKILDIGCGNGQFLAYLKLKGFTEMCGVETDLKKVEFCKNDLSFNVSHICELDQFLTDFKGFFDLVVLMEVIYYFPDEKLFPYLKAIYEALKDNGVIIVQVFNGANFTGAFYKIKDPDINRTYYEGSLKKCLEETEFKVISLRARKCKIDSAGRFLWFCLQNMWFLVLKIIYILERGISGNPSIFSKSISCVAKK